MPIKTIKRAEESVKAADVAKSIRYAADNGANVINLSLEVEDLMRGPVLPLADNGANGTNLSLGGGFKQDVITEAVQYAESKGVVVVAASGNNGSNWVAWPARTPEAVAVGSSRNGKRSGFSQGGERLDISAPGERISSAQPGGKYGEQSGTSMAAPYVAGAAALIIAQHPNWTGAQVKEHLKRSVNDLGAPGWDPSFGYGELNLFKAAYGQNLPAVTRPPDFPTRPLYGQNLPAVTRAPEPPKRSL
jgi:subtilisin family serine protease